MSLTMVTSELLSVRGLTVGVGTGPSAVDIVEQLDLDIAPTETLALVGESGCGKTTAALTLMGLQPPSMSVRHGSVRFDGTEITDLKGGELRRLRGGAMAMVFQDPMSGLNPLRRVGRQIAEAVRIHQSRVPRSAARAQAVDLLERVGIHDARRRAEQYPHEFSGGMRQRAMIAMAIANGPRLLIADEPTTALDATVQAQVIDVLLQAKRSTGAALLLVTHDLGLVGELADRVAVMYAGRLVEIAAATNVLDHPQHPYTVGLLESVPRLGTRDVALLPIPGQAPLAGARPPGCPFHPRCVVGRDRERCRTERPMLPGTDVHPAACHYPGELQTSITSPRRRTAVGERSEVLLRVRGVRVEFPVRRGLTRRSVGRLRAVDDVDIDISRGETVAVVGESGSGKTTLARALVGLTDVDAGTVELDGFGEVLGRTDEAIFRRRVQLVFQDPYASLNPRMRLASIVGEPLRVHGKVRSRAAIDARVTELFDLVGLDASMRSRYAHELSGGERQRVGLARALALRPDLVILDEPVSSLDVSVQAQILALLEQLRAELHLAYLLISHDLAVVERIADRVVVMYLGRIVESGAAVDVFGTPGHPYTRALIASTPGQQRSLGDAAAPRGELPSALDAPGGCAFRSRCPHAISACATTVPGLQPAVTGTNVACIRADDLATARPKG